MQGLPPQVISSLYAALIQLPRRDHHTPPRELPPNGIYAFFERGETIPWPGGTTDRIVRVGTHKVDGNFPGRIRAHYGRVRSLGGNKNGSVFRKHLGGALLRQTDP